MDFKGLKQNKWLVVLAVLGVLFLIVGSFVGRGGSMATLVHPAMDANTTQQGTNSVKETATTDSGYEQQIDTQLTNILGHIDGVHAVSVMVTVDSSGSVQVANNTQTTHSQSGNGNSQSTTESVQVFTETNNDGTHQPYVVERITPTVRGVLVTVNADDFYLAKSEIIDAITNVLDVPAYKISVEPQKAG